MSFEGWFRCFRIRPVETWFRFFLLIFLAGFFLGRQGFLACRLGRMVVLLSLADRHAYGAAGMMDAVDFV